MNTLIVRGILLAEEAEFDPIDVTPTWVGFLITFLLAVVTVFLLWDMMRRIRRTRYRGEVREQLEAEHAARLADQQGGDEESTTAREG